MIKLEYRNNVRMKRYSGMLKKLGLTLKDALSVGYLGNYREMTAAKARKIRNQLDAEGQKTFDAIAPADLSLLTDSAKVKIPAFYLDAQSRSFLSYLDNKGQEELRRLTMSKAQDIEDLITEYEKLFPVLAKDKTLKEDQRSNMYSILYYLFVTNGYAVLKQKSRFYTALGVDVCPYCNRNRIRPFTKNKVTHVTGELDHFYCKEKYPYLALTRENLVPSCSVCNGEGGKHNHDFYHSGLVNPFTLNDSNEFSFGLDISAVKGDIDYKTIPDMLKIEFHFNSGRLRRNSIVFNWRQHYTQSEYKEKATSIFIEAGSWSSKPYQDQTVLVFAGTTVKLRLEDLFHRTMHVWPFETEYLHCPDSKFTIDVFKDVLSKYGATWPF